MKLHGFIVLAIVSLLGALGVPDAAMLQAASGPFVYPLVGTQLSSGFGERKHPVFKVARHHNGIDLAAPEGALIRSIQSGVIVFADPYAGYGNLVVVRHSNGLTSHYGHCQSLKVRAGELVRAGQIIATVGSTGRVTGSHLHFEIRSEGKPYDPEKIFPGLRVEAQG